MEDGVGGIRAPTSGRAQDGGGQAASPRDVADRRTLTVLGTSDLHGNIYNWDYYRDGPYRDAEHDHVGLAKVSSLVETVRRDRGAGSTLLFDNGDTIEGTPLAYYYARVRPITDGVVHPMARAMNLLGYDAAVVGNHEFNYGVPVLRAYERQVQFPLLGANVHHAGTGNPAFEPYVLKEVELGFHRPVRVGVLGLTTPGTAIWDRGNVAGRLEFADVVAQAGRWVPELRRRGADVVVVLCHSGIEHSSSYGDALPAENVSERVAVVVPGIDMVLCGHTHVDVPKRIVNNGSTGEPVLLTQPKRWGMRLSVADLVLARSGDGFRVVSRHASTLSSNRVDADPRVLDRLRHAHDRVVAYVNAKVGTAVETMATATSRYQDTAAIDLVNIVQAHTVKRALAGSPHGSLPVLSATAPFSRDAAIPAGRVSVRDVAGLYRYDNTLTAVVLTGAQLRDYLERSAEYFKPVDNAGPFAPDDLTNAATDRAPGGTPDYHYDVVAGLDAPLTYEVDLGNACGARIVGLGYGGTPVAAADRFVLATNSYRQSGGGCFPHVPGAPVVYDERVEVRQRIIEWIAERGTIDPAACYSDDWRLTYHGTPISVS